MIFDSPELFSRRTIKTFIRHFGGNGGHNFDTRAGALGYALIHYAFVANIRPQHVLCVGSERGFIPAVLGLACRENRAGHVDFVDAGYDRDNPNHWGGIGFWKQNDAARHFKKFDVDPWITTHVMTSREFAKNTKTRFQYIYIDGDHSYEGVKRDYRQFWPRLDRGGCMVFHDVLLKRHPEHNNFGVWKFWEEVPALKKITIPFTYSTTLPSGLGIIQK